MQLALQSIACVSTRLTLTLEVAPAFWTQRRLCTRPRSLLLQPPALDSKPQRSISQHPWMHNVIPCWHQHLALWGLHRTGCRRTEATRSISSSSCEPSSLLAGESSYDYAAFFDLRCN